MPWKATTVSCDSPGQYETAHTGCVKQQKSTSALNGTIHGLKCFLYAGIFGYHVVCSG